MTSGTFSTTTAAVPRLVFPARGTADSFGAIALGVGIEPVVNGRWVSGLRIKNHQMMNPTKHTARNTPTSFNQNIQGSSLFDVVCLDIFDDSDFAVAIVDALDVTDAVPECEPVSYNAFGDADFVMVVVDGMDAHDIVSGFEPVSYNAFDLLVVVVDCMDAVSESDPALYIDAMKFFRCSLLFFIVYDRKKKKSNHCGRPLVFRMPNLPPDDVRGKFYM
jgi:hypothetical protein